MENIENKSCHSNNPKARKKRPPSWKTKRLEEGYIHVTGLKENPTEEYVRNYFAGLDVVDVFFQVNKKNCRSGTALVKFARPSHTAAALKFNSKKRPLKLELVITASWLNHAVQDKDVDKQSKKPGSPACSGLPPNCPCYVRVMNLPSSTTTEDLRNLVVEKETENLQITFITSEENTETKEALIVLESMKQLQQCLEKNQTTFLGREIYIFPSSEGQVRQLLKNPSDVPLLKIMQAQKEKSSMASDERKCMYVRNFPADVSKSDIQTFFAEFHVTQENIFLLYDENGGGMGEALVKFPNEQVAMSAKSLHQQPFLGTGVLLLRISEEQMKHFDDLLLKGK